MLKIESKSKFLNTLKDVGNCELLRRPMVIKRLGVGVTMYNYYIFIDYVQRFSTLSYTAVIFLLFGKFKGEYKHWYFKNYILKEREIGQLEWNLPLKIFHSFLGRQFVLHSFSLKALRDFQDEVLVEESFGGIDPLIFIGFGSLIMSAVHFSKAIKKLESDLVNLSTLRYNIISLYPLSYFSFHCFLFSRRFFDRYISTKLLGSFYMLRQFKVIGNSNNLLTG